MKVTVTHLKAPWPAGVQVGHVVEFPGEAAPSWAAGKFELAREDAEAHAVWEPPPAPPPEPEKQDAAQALAAAQQEVHELKQLLSAMTFERDAALAKVTELQAAVDAAQKKPAK